jgi:uncharacterized OB-fold protein
MGKIERVKLKGEGKIFSFTEVQDGLEELNLQKPYIVAMVELDEGARVTGQIIDCDACDISIGTPVRATLRKLSDEGASGVIHYGYKFVPIREKAP